MAFTYGTVNYCTSADHSADNIYQVRFGYQVNSQDTVNNRSNITLRLEARSTSSKYTTYGYNQTPTIDGVTLSARTFDFRSTNTWQNFGERTFDVDHNADGSYSVSKSGSFTTNLTGARVKSGSASVMVTLPTIPRASSITVNDANIGSATNIVINKASDSFTTTLSYKASGQNSWTTIVSKTSNQVYGWTVPTSFYALIPNSKTITCEFQAETFSGNTLVGTKTTTATFTATGNPLINSFTLVDTNSTTTALTGDSSKMIKYASNVKATVSTSGQNSATISSNKVNGVSTSGGIATFNSASTNSYQLVVTDSRGYQTSQTKTMTMIDYVLLTINATIKRHTPTDGKIDISFSGNYFNGSFGSQNNSLTVQYRSREKNGSWGSWTSLSPTVSGNTYSQSDYVISGYDYTKQYEFQIRAIDEIQTKVIEGINVPKGKPIFNWDEDSFNINGDIYQNETKLIEQGTWTPVLDNATVTYTTQVGIYRKIGDLIYVTWKLQGTITAVTSPAYAYISGLPYSAGMEQAGSLYEYGNCFYQNNASTPRLVRVTGSKLGIQDGSVAGVSISSWEAGHGTFYLSGSATYIKGQ